MLIKTFLTLATVATLAACVAPTPYQVAGAEGKGFGYTSNKLSDQLYRVRFTGSNRTPTRWADAFVLYRSAQIAKEAGAPAFKIIEGTVDASVLSGEDVFGQGSLHADVEVSQAPQQQHVDGDQVVSMPEIYTQRTAGAMPVFGAPPARAQAPMYIYTPIYTPAYGVGPVVQGRSVLVELRSDLKDMDEKTFVTDDVLARLGPRIKQAPPPSDAPRPASNT